MKRQFCLNRKLHKIDLNEQNVYLMNKINTMKPVINTNIPNYNDRNNLIKSFSKSQSK